MLKHAVLIASLRYVALSSNNSRPCRHLKPKEEGKLISDAVDLRAIVIQTQATSFRCRSAAADILTPEDSKVSLPSFRGDKTPRVNPARLIKAKLYDKGFEFNKW